MGQSTYHGKDKVHVYCTNHWSDPLPVANHKHTFIRMAISSKITNISFYVMVLAKLNTNMTFYLHGQVVKYNNVVQRLKVQWNALLRNYVLLISHSSSYFKTYAFSVLAWWSKSCFISLLWSTKAHFDLQYCLCECTLKFEKKKKAIIFLQFYQHIGMYWGVILIFTNGGGGWSVGCKVWGNIFQHIVPQVDVYVYTTKCGSNNSTFKLFLMPYNTIIFSRWYRRIILGLTVPGIIII